VAQGNAGVNLEPHAEGDMGARSMTQTLTSTDESTRAKDRHFEPINVPRWNIAAAIHPDRDLHRKWHKSVRCRQARLAFTLASYNAG
jgi:membrane-bound lytic murein transglycosylase MltF